MPIVTFLPSGSTVNAASDTFISDAARAAGVSIALPCGGKGVCGRCLVRANGVRVPACRTRVGDAPLTVEADRAEEQGQFSHLIDDLCAVEPALLPTGDPSPPVQRISLTVPPPNAGDGLSDLDRFARATGLDSIVVPVELLAQLPNVLREQDGAVTLHYYTEGQTSRAVSLTAEPRAAYGLAVDLGTTTVAAHLVSLETGVILASHTRYNAQIDCGLDIISRIHYARTAEKLAELRTRALDTVNGLTDALCESAGIDPGSVLAVSLAGNTTMTHLLLGIIPEYIRLHPYTPAVYDVPVYTARELGLGVCPHAPVLIAPSVGSYVGGDITAGLLCTRLSGAVPDDGPMLFIDIGTNGEIVLGNEDFLLGCACSAGPAFEGGSIKHGCRAAAGAIERVTFEDGKAVCETIGNLPPTGICGSGVISLIAGLFAEGLIDAAGRFTSRANLVTEEGRRCFPLGGGITISETDIDNLVRAKAAVFSACQTLLDSVGMTFEELGRVYVAGGFGRFLDLDNAAAIGLLPKCPPRADGTEAVSFLGNTSLGGAYMTLVSARHRETLREIAQRITYIDLSAESGYMDAYMAALFLPHTSLDFGL